MHPDLVGLGIVDAHGVGLLGDEAALQNIFTELLFELADQG